MSFRQIERDLAAGIAESDNEHALAREGLRIAVAARMQDRATEGFHAWPRWRMWEVSQACRDDGDGRLNRLISGFGAPVRSAAADFAHLRTEARLQIKSRRVPFEVFDNLGARGIAAIGRRHRQAGQRRVIAISVQMEPVVVAPPDWTDRVRLLQDDNAETPGFETGRSGQAGRPCADDDGVARIRHEAI